MSLTANSGPLSMTHKAVVEIRRSEMPKKVAQIVSVPPGSIVPVNGRKSKILLIGGGDDWPSKAKGNSSSPAKDTQKGVLTRVRLQYPERSLHEEEGSDIALQGGVVTKQV